MLQKKKSQDLFPSKLSFVVFVWLVAVWLRGKSVNFKPTITCFEMATLVLSEFLRGQKGVVCMCDVYVVHVWSVYMLICV